MSESVEADKKLIARARSEIDALRLVVDTLAGLPPDARPKVIAAVAVLSGVVEPEVVLRELQRQQTNLNAFLNEEEPRTRRR